MLRDLDQLCRGVGDPNVKDTIKRNQATKLSHYYSNKGYTKSKDYRYLGELPMWVKFHPETSKFFDNDMDDHERKKNLYAFLRKYGEGFLVVDKL